MTTACVLGCRSADGNPYAAAPGRLACDRCGEKLYTAITDIELIYVTLDTVEELTPSGTKDNSGSRRMPPGPRSPAVDAIIVHTDLRSTTDGPPAAFATVESWARMIREDLSEVPPPGRATFTREMATIRFHWHWVLGQPWVDEFATEMHEVLNGLKAVARMQPRLLRIGPCPVEDCGTVLKVKVGDDEIRCRGCGTSWPRSRWFVLGDGWTDYARLSIELGVAVGTLWRWASEDHWTIAGTKGRRLIYRAQAMDSWQRRRGHLPLDQAG